MQVVNKITTVTAAEIANIIVSPPANQQLVMDTGTYQGDAHTGTVVLLGFAELGKNDSISNLLRAVKDAPPVLFYALRDDRLGRSIYQLLRRLDMASEVRVTIHRVYPISASKSGVSNFAGSPVVRRQEHQLITVELK